MKVLEPGTKTLLHWTIQHRCTGWGNSGNGCDALLEIEKTDLRYFKGNDSPTWGGRDPAVTFKCPCCSTLTDIGVNDWPKDYRSLKAYHSSSKWIDEVSVDVIAKVA